MSQEPSKAIETVDRLLQQLDQAISHAREKIETDHPRSSPSHLEQLLDQKRMFENLKKNLTEK